MADRALLDTILARLASRGVQPLLADLGYLDGATHLGRGAFLTRCFWHSERTPSNAVRVKDGAIVAYCHGSCQRGGGALDLIAGARGLTLRGRDFGEVVELAAHLAGVSLDRHAPLPPRPPAPPPEPPRSYPPATEVAALWKACVTVADDSEASAWIESRGLDPFAVEDRDLARALPLGAPLPRWASYQGQPWTKTGHRLVVPVFDAAGVQRSVRSSRIVAGDSPKRLPPAGHRAAGLVLADPLARLVLSGEDRAGWPSPLRLIIAEGETDFLTWATRYSSADEDAPGVLGVVSGAWTEDIATRLPPGLEILIDTDHDKTGDRYADDIVTSLHGRARALRSEAA